MRRKWVRTQKDPWEGTCVMPLKGMFAACGAVLLCAIASATVNAQYSDDYRSTFTFSRVVELPGGRTLQPGKYVFRRVDSLAGRYILEVLDEDETKTLATIVAVDPSDEAVIMFGETPANTPQPIRYWYHSARSGGPIGYEFVYPKEQATRIAKATNQRVLMTDEPANDSDAMIRADVSAVNPNGAITDYRENVLRQAEKTTGEEGFSVATVASVQPLTLIGLVALGTVLVVVRVQRHSRPRLLERPLEQLGALSASEMKRRDRQMV